MAVVPGKVRGRVSSAWISSFPEINSASDLAPEWKIAREHFFKKNKYFPKNSHMPDLWLFFKDNWTSHPEKDSLIGKIWDKSKIGKWFYKKNSGTEEHLNKWDLYTFSFCDSVKGGNSTLRLLSQT